MNKTINVITLTVLFACCLLVQGCQTEVCEKEVVKNVEPFRNTKITQIGIIVEDVEKSAKIYADIFGMEVPEVSLTDPVEISNMKYKGKTSKAQAKLAFFKFENTTIELIEPVGGPSTWRDFLKQNGPGVHHIAFDVKGMDKYVELFDKRGAKLVQRGEWAAYTGGQYGYVDTTDQLAVIIELLENF